VSDRAPSPKRDFAAFWRPLRGRDFVLLPLVVVVTVMAMLGGGEMAARVIWPMSLGTECQYGTPDGARFKPKCVSRYKAVDGPWVEDHFNDCGYRAAESCRVTPGQLRVAVIGSSMARGHGAPYEATFSARAGKLLSRRCGKPVDFQNLSTDVNDVPILDHRVPEALKLKPSAILLLISSYDIQNVDARPPSQKQKQHLDLASLKHLVTTSRLVTVGQHYIYEDPAAQISVFLNTGADDSHGYAVTPLPAKWEARVEHLGAIVARGSAEAKAAKVPFILAYAPRRAQVLLDIPKYRRPNVDPLAIDRRLQQIAAADGAIFIDTTPSFAASPRYNSLFYIADGHPTAEGHAIIARDVASTLLTLPAFAGCDRSPLPMPS
jgi:hypothetical protein